MINLNEKRNFPLDIVLIQEDMIPDVDLSTIHVGDWMYGIGTIDYTTVAVLNQLGRIGYQIKKRE